MEDASDSNDVHGVKTEKQKMIAGAADCCFSWHAGGATVDELVSIVEIQGMRCGMTAVKHEPPPHRAHRRRALLPHRPGAVRQAQERRAQEAVAPAASVRAGRAAFAPRG